MTTFLEGPSVSRLHRSDDTREAVLSAFQRAASLPFAAMLVLIAHRELAPACSENEGLAWLMQVGLDIGHPDNFRKVRGMLQHPEQDLVEKPLIVRAPSKTYGLSERLERAGHCRCCRTTSGRARFMLSPAGKVVAAEFDLYELLMLGPEKPRRKPRKRQRD